MALNRVLVTDGDSITAGGLLDGTTITPWPSLVTLNGSWTIHNVAASGQTLATCLANAPTTVDPFYDALAPENVVTIWAGTNDIANNSTNVNAVYANLVSYVAARHAIGWKVIVMTMLTKGNPSTSDIARDAYNALILANTAGADLVVSFNSTPLGIDGGASNSTYFLSDNLHPNQFSVNTIETPALNTAINNLVVPGQTATFVQQTSNRSGTVGNFSVPYPANTGIGNVLLAVAWCSTGTTITSFTDSVNTWTQIGTTQTPTGFNVNFYKVDSAVGGASTPKMTMNNSAAANLGMGLLEYSGRFKSPPLNASVLNTLNGSASFAVGPLVTTTPNDLLVMLGFISGFTNFSSQLGWQQRLTGSNAAISDDTISGAAGSYTNTVTHSASASWAGVLLDFQLIPFPTVYSVPDCRVPPAGPNASRTVQGTKIYDVQRSSNPAIPPTDSRVSIPIDSRSSTAGTTPQNSRTAGVYGPGE